MKIIGLVSRNIKNLKAIEIAPTGNEVTLTGANGAGKSAILDSIFSALTGIRLKDAIRHGEDRAAVEINMGDFIVRKRWTEKGETIQVYSIQEDGKKHTYSSPQTFLNEKIGMLSFDPLDFKDMKPAEQVELLKDIVKLNFDDINGEAKKIYDARTIINSRVKDAIAQLKNLEAPEPKTPSVEISFKDELEKINQLREKREAFLEAKQEKDELVAKISAAEQWIKDKEEEIKNLQESIEAAKGSIKEINENLESKVLPAEVTQEEILAAESSLQDIEKQNVIIKSANRYRTVIKAGEKARKESDALTEKLQRLEQDKATRVANAAFPVPGLSLGDESVVYEGIPFIRLSTGQQIRVSTAIGMALNPELKVIFIREGSLLDKRNRKDIIAQAKGKDYQVWFEVCDESGEVGFYIENGEVAAIDGKKVG